MDNDHIKELERINGVYKPQVASLSNFNVEFVIAILPDSNSPWKLAS